MNLADRSRRAGELMDEVMTLLLRKQQEPPEDLYADSPVRVKPRSPDFQAGATAELES